MSTPSVINLETWAMISVVEFLRLWSKKLSGVVLMIPIIKGLGNSCKIPWQFRVISELKTVSFTLKYIRLISNESN